MARVSVIVPVYNVAGYLTRCVDSILSQTLDDIEVILVDDGSTDGSGEICDSYAVTDPSVRVVHQVNAGLSAARNAGLNLASGEFIGFVDGDDYVMPGMFEELYRTCMEENVEIAACDFAYMDRMSDEAPFSGKAVKLSSEEFFKKVLTAGSTVGMGVWNKLYRKGLFYDTQFTPGILHEDTDILYRLVFQAEFAAYVPGAYYIHPDREGSITTFAYGDRDYDRFEANGRMYRYIEDNHPAILSEAADNRARSMLSIVNNMIGSGVYDRKMYRMIRDEVKKLMPVIRSGGVTPASMRLKLRVLEAGYVPYAVMRRIYGSFKRKGVC